MVSRALADRPRPQPTRARVREHIVRINRVYYGLYDALTRYIVVYGGRRSGKSVAVSQLLVKRAAENPGRVIVCMRKVAATLRLSVWPRIQSALDEAGLLASCTINKTDKTITLANGSMFIFVGADDPEKLKSLEGATDYWLEELPEYDEIDLDTVDAGLSADVYPPCQIWLTFNPVPILEHFIPWAAKRFVRAVEHNLSKIACKGDITILRTYYKDNKYCPAATAKLLEGYKETNPDLYKLWALGEYTFVAGVIFKNWDVVDVVPADAKDIGYGLDFGFTVDPTVLMRVWTRPLPEDRLEVWLKQEIYETEMTNRDIGLRLRELGVSRKAEIIADSAEPKSIEEIRQMGFNVKSFGGKDSVRAGISNMQGMVIHIVRGSTETVKEFSTYSWKKGKDGNERPEPIDRDNHAIDAARMRLSRGPVSAASSIL